MMRVSSITIILFMTSMATIVYSTDDISQKGNRKFFLNEFGHVKTDVPGIEAYKLLTTMPKSTMALNSMGQGHIIDTDVSESSSSDQERRGQLARYIGLLINTLCDKIQDVSYRQRIHCYETYSTGSMLVDHNDNDLTKENRKISQKIFGNEDSESLAETSKEGKRNSRYKNQQQNNEYFGNHFPAEKRSRMLSITGPLTSLARMIPPHGRRHESAAESTGLTDYQQMILELGRK